MTSLSDSELEVLNTSAAQVTNLIQGWHHEFTSHLVATTASREDLAVAAAPPDSTSLDNILNNAVNAPGTTSIATVPQTIDTPMQQLLSQIQTLDSYVSLLTAYCVYNEHQAPYDITDPAQAAAFTQAMAKWRNYVLTGGVVKALAGYLPVGSIVSQDFTKSVTAADLHLEFLTEIFGGFSLPTAALAELDSILTNTVAQLGNLNLSFETQTETLDHFLTYYFFATVPGTGGDGEPPAMYEAKVRTFYLHISQSAWKASLGKSTVSQFSFEMNYFDMDTSMNAGLVANDMNAINSSIQTLTGKTTAEVNTLMNMQAVHADPQKS